MITINTLLEDIDATNASRRYRKSINSRQQSRYAHNWWQSSLVLLTRFNGLSPMEIQAGILSEFGMEFQPSALSSLLFRAVSGQLPNPVYREYTKSLPGIVKATGLSGRPPTAAERMRMPACGRSGKNCTKTVYYFPNPKRARSILLSNFPDLLPLFVELDRRANGA